MATAEASFNTSMDSMSLGLMSLVEPKKITPSNTYSGSVLAEMEFVPRMDTEPVLPGTEDPWLMLRPAVLPCNAYIMFVTGRFMSLSFGTEATEPVMSDRFCSP
jgi:hypothetical protein